MSYDGYRNPPYIATAMAVRAQAMEMDWMSRHKFLQRIASTRPSLVHDVVRIMSPRECLWGKSGHRPLAKVIRLPSKNLRPTKQRLITEFMVLVTHDKRHHP